MRQIILINVAGRDRPGITASLAGLLANYAVTVLDIDQAVIHNHLSWGMLVAVDDSPETNALFKELLFKAQSLDLDIRFTPVSDQQYAVWVRDGGRDLHMITLLGRQLSAAMVARVTELISNHGWNIFSIQRISPRDALSNSLVAVEIRISHHDGAIEPLRDACLALGPELGADIAVQQDNIWRRSRRLVCFDMDSTLIQGEAINMMAATAGVGGQVAAITARAMNGEIDFNQSFRERMKLLKGLPEVALHEIDRQMPITEGAERLLKNLKRLGYRTAILSGGFTWFADRLARRLGIDHVFANTLQIADGALTGEVDGAIVNEKRKAELLRALAKQQGIRLEQVIAVGDGANDIPMLSIAGLGIAFHAKPTVRARAETAFATVGLDAILYLIGMREHEIE